MIWFMGISLRLPGRGGPFRRLADRRSEMVRVGDDAGEEC
jgi:hypothetical protein